MRTASSQIYGTSLSAHPHAPLKEADHHFASTNLTQKYVPCRSIIARNSYLQNQDIGHLDEVIPSCKSAHIAHIAAHFPHFPESELRSYQEVLLMFAIRRQKDNAPRLVFRVGGEEPGWKLHYKETRTCIENDMLCLPAHNFAFRQFELELQLVLYHESESCRCHFRDQTDLPHHQNRTPYAGPRECQLFTVVAFADIKTIDDRFRTVWLPTALDLGKPGQDLIPHDLNEPSGRFYDGFNSLKDTIKTLDYNLNRLHHVFKTYVNSLEVDKLTTGFFAIIHGYGLLFHMHAVYAKLHRIQIRAPTLILSAKPAAVKARRLPPINAIESRLVHPPHGNSFLVYYYRDNYNALPSTEEGRQLTCCATSQVGESRSEGIVLKARTRRVAGVEDVVRMIYIAYKATWQMHSDLNTAMRARGREQGTNDGPGGLPGGRSSPKLPQVLPLVPATRLKLAVAAEVPTDDDSDPFAITPPMIEDPTESFKEDQDSEETSSTEDFLL
ncbi:hypothetical protein EDD18DRAFT_1326269 [Armillaria luteobubalina]|uniref:Uncharacterized protein n=1 Tax=Armillaria luteobubalina TaxID=153913 RepID=A0AA39UVJ0_9AGAR|nr:hypothetical protein EDD18DRAFT_1326269 [Armillaria luteobubalina]